MIKTYRSLLRIPHARAFVLAGVGAWMAGLIADSAGGETAFLVAVVAGGAAVIVAARGRGRLRSCCDKRKEPIQ